MSKLNWFKLAAIFVLFVIVSLALAYGIERLIFSLGLEHSRLGFLVYPLVFVVAGVVNMSFIPLPSLVPLMIATSAAWNPILIALAASLGASLGETTGYYAGYIGKKVAIPETARYYTAFEQWINKYGMWAIALLSFQPILPVEIGGLTAGAAKYPYHKFIIALWIGRFPKYLLFIYLGASLLEWLHIPVSAGLSG